MAKPNKNKPKRDPNKPLPKPQQRGGKLLKLLFGGILAVGMTLVTLYSLQIGRWPWQWSQEDLEGFQEYSEEQAKQAKQTVEKQLGKVDWQALGDKITAKTKQLFDSMPEWESRLDERIEKLEEERGGEGGAVADAGAAGEGAGNGGGTAGEGQGAPAEPAQIQPPSPYMQGCVKFREAIRTYKGTVPREGEPKSDAEIQRELKRAKGQFREAQDLLTQAYEDAETRGDAAEAAEIEDVLRQCNVYLEDCSKRETL